MTMRDAFGKADYELHKGYGKLCYIPMPGVSDHGWFFVDHNLKPSIHYFDGTNWVDASYFEDYELLDGQLNVAIDLSDLKITKANVDYLPAICQEAYHREVDLDRREERGEFGKN